MAVPERNEQDKRLDAIVKPVRHALYEVDTFWHTAKEQIEGMGRDYGGLEMAPDYQRGHVWTTEQQERYIENMMKGAVPTSGRLLQFNCPDWNDSAQGDSDLPAGLQCLDGLQRFTAVQRFLADEIRPFGLPLSEFMGTAYSPKRYRFRLAVFGYRTRREVLEHYLDYNAGGTPHSTHEIARVRGLLAACQR